MTYSPPFSRTSRIDELAFEVAELVGEIKAVSSMDTKPWLHRKMRIKTIHSSLAIEGNELAENEVESIIDGQKILGDPKDILEVQNAIAAYDGLDSLDPYSIDDLLCSHRVLMNGLVKEAGRFRSGNVDVYDGDVLIHAGTPANYVPEVMRDLFGWLTSTGLHPLIASCIFHYEFEFIHPFADGNSRLGRLWHTLLLSKWRPSFQWIPVEPAIFSRQKDYYDALACSNANATCNPFIELMLEIIRDSIVSCIRPADKQAQQEAAALDLFRNDPNATMNDLARFLEVSPRTAARIVKALRESGRLERSGSKKTGRWQVLQGGSD